jgi:hypothetical protein
MRLAIDAYPDIADTTVQVVTQVPGLAAEEIEQQISIPIERAMNGLPGLNVMRSKNTFGLSTVVLVFDDGDVVVTKDSNSKEKKEYKSTEIKSIKYYDSKSKKWIKFVPLMAQKSLPSVWNKNPKPYKTPIFLKPVYEGENVSAYIHYISTITNTKTLHLEGTNYVFYFKVKNEDVAKGYWMGSSIGAKMLLKIVFKPYPVMKETVSNLDTKEFYKDPISLIRTFDSLLK